MKTFKKLALSGTLLSIMLFLSGCMSRDDAGNPTGFIYDYLVVPTQQVIIWFADIFNGNFGLSIIAITLIVRILILPLNLSQSKKSIVQQEKTAFIKPELDVIQEKQKKAVTPEEKAAAQQEMMALYKENNMSMLGGVGCLPLLLQMPVFTAMFQAIQLSEEIAESTFLGINLGTPSIPMAIAAGLIYLGQSYISMIGLPPDQKKQMRTMMYMNPIMILFFTISSPAGLALYWLVGGIFGIFSTLLTNLYLKPRIRLQIEEEMKSMPKRSKPAIKKAEPVPAVNIDRQPSKKRNRNAGKQQRRG